MPWMPGVPPSREHLSTMSGTPTASTFGLNATIGYQRDHAPIAQPSLGAG